MDTGMRFPVANQAGLLRERFAANITDIWSFAGVYEQMLPVGCATCEGFTANVTIVRSVSGVSHHVLLQSVILGE